MYDVCMDRCLYICICICIYVYIYMQMKGVHRSPLSKIDRNKNKE
jgi:hypothetical protein